MEEYRGDTHVILVEDLNTSCGGMGESCKWDSTRGNYTVGDTTLNNHFSVV